MAYASAKFAIALCDRCGFRYKLLELQKEWNGLKVCHTCYEKKHPQLEPHTAPADPQALKSPRADIRPGGGCLVQLDLYYWPGQFETKNNSMQPEISGDVINTRR